MPKYLLLRTARVALLIPIALLAACDTLHESPDFERHALSQLNAPMQGGDFYWFDVKLTADMPGDSPAAEDLRMAWLGKWLAQRGLCASGFEILERRPFDFLEHNPARYDLRYKVQCKPVPPG